jgi:hypothetical protein
VRYASKVAAITIGKTEEKFVIQSSKPLSVLATAIVTKDPKVQSVLFKTAKSNDLISLSNVIEDIQEDIVVDIDGTQTIIKNTIEGAEDEVAEFKIMTKQKEEIDKIIDRRINLLVYGGLFGLSAQWGLMARLTWWEFSWDVMEPISYFVTFGTSILGYIFYIMVRQDYTFPALSDATHSKFQLRLYQRKGFDIEKYVTLERKYKDIFQSSRNLKTQ